DPGEESTAIVASLLDAAAAANGQALQAKKAQELAELIRQLQEGPLRYARFLRLLAGQGGARRAHVVLEDGTSVYPVVPDPDVAEALRRGDTVLLDAQARALLFRQPEDTAVGEEARLERRLGEEVIEVTLREHERHVFRASEALARKLDAGAA